MKEEYKIKFISDFPEHIQKRINKGKGIGSDIPEGWLNIVIDLDKQLSEINDDYTIDQIKEKFASLSFYFSGIDYSQVRSILEDAESKSMNTCQICSKPGHVRKKDWWVTLCDKHAKLRDENE